MRYLSTLLVVLMIGCFFGWVITGCSGGSNEVVVKEEQPQTPQEQSMRDQMMKLMQQSREMRPKASEGGQPSPQGN